MTQFRPLAIAHLDTGLSLRGGQVQLLMLARHLGARGHRQIIVCPDRSPLAEKAQAEGFRIFLLPNHDPGHLHGAALLRAEMATFRPDVLHAHDGVAQTVSWLASVGTGAKRVVSRRVTYLPPRLLDYRLKYTYTADAVIVVSESVRQALETAGVPRSKAELIPDGVEIPTGQPNPELRSRVRAAWNFEITNFVMGCVAALSREKGQDLAVEAFAQVVTRLPCAGLVLAGEGHQDALRLLGPKARDKRILLVREDINRAEFFSALDLYLMPSRSEGFGSSALLAMAHGLPVVAARTGGLPELVEEGMTGWLIEPESPSSLAAAILEAARDPARLQSFGQNARRRAEEFSAQKMALRTEALYYRLLADGSPRR